MTSSQAEQQLILLSAGTAARRSAMADRAGQLMADIDWSRLAGALRSRRLLGPLGPRIIELAEGRESERFRAAVDESIATGRRHSAFLQLVSLRAIDMLADAGIRSSALKGPLLGEDIYGDPGRRMSGDVDLLVPAEQLQSAVSVIRELGYGAPTDHVDDSGLPLLHLMLLHERKELPPVELHWRIHWYEQIFARERLLPPEVDLCGKWRPDPAYQLAALLLFYARDGFVGLRLATDLSAWWDVYGDGLPAGALDQLLESYPALARVLSVAARVAEKVVGLPAREILAEKAPKLRVRERTVVRLANPNPHSSRSQVYADMGLVDGLLMPRGGFSAFVRRQVLPPSEVLDQQARHGGRRRARSPLARGVGVLARYGLTLARLMRAPETLR